MNFKDIAVVFMYGRTHKYGINVLVGAIENSHVSKYVRVYLVKPEEAEKYLPTISSKHSLKILAFSLLTTYLAENLDLIRGILSLARRLGFILVAGGPHPTGDPAGTLISLGFDYAFVGEGEEPIVKFIESILDGDDPCRIKGLAFKDNSKIVINDRFIARNLDEYPPFAAKHGLFNPIEISRGCPFACKYCQVSYMFTPYFRHRSIESIVASSLELIRKGIKDVRFISPDSFGYGSSGKDVSVDKLLELIDALQRIRKLGGRIYLGTFPSEVRPEHVVDDVVRELVGRVDNKRIIVGAQTGSERLLKLIGRGHTSQDVINAVEILRKYGFQVDVDYIFGLPGETEEDIEDTIKHMQLVSSLGARVHAHVFLPLPGTPYATAPPGSIPPKVRKVIYKLLGRGMLYGQWERQEKLARKIAELRSRGLILPNFTKRHYLKLK